MSSKNCNRCVFAELRKREVLFLIKLIDSHCDTITKIFINKENLLENTGHLDIKKLSLYENPLQFFAIYLSDEYLDDAFKHTLKFIDYFYEQIGANGKYINSAGSYEEILSNRENNLISAVLAIEGGEAVSDNLQNISVFYELGVRLLTLTWNHRNCLGDGIGVKDGKGLTDLGKKAVEKMNELGMIVDVSHLNESGFWDVYGIAQKPFIASHSNSYTICNHPRNLKDDQIEAVAKTGGMIGLNIFTNFVGENASIDGLMKHIDYIINLVGDDFLGLGCDLDGITSAVSGISDVSDLVKLYQIINGKYGRVTADKIFFDNYDRFLEKML